MNLADCMDDLGAALETIDGLRVFPFWADRVNPPAAMVGFPEKLTYDATMGRGGDRLELHVIVMVSRADARSARDELAAYADGAGSSSVKAAIEAYPATAYDSARVVDADFGPVAVAGVEYQAATFTIDLIGPGA